MILSIGNNNIKVVYINYSVDKRQQNTINAVLVLAKMMTPTFRFTPFHLPISDGFWKNINHSTRKILFEIFFPETIKSAYTTILFCLVSDINVTMKTNDGMYYVI